MLSYAFDDEPIKCVDLLSGDTIPEELEDGLFDECITKIAHNASFERNGLRRIGYNIPVEQWQCTAVMSAYCGLPFSLDEVSKKLDITNKKLDTGKALIKYFSCPCKPTRINGMRTRNYPSDNIEKWEQYKYYNVVDVEGRKEIYRRLEKYKIPDFERRLYILDQNINDRGILVDMRLAKNAIAVDEWYTGKLTNYVKLITGLDNPNSPIQLRRWIENEINKDKK